MKYYEVLFTVSSHNNDTQDAYDLIAALAGELGFEAFEEDRNGMKGYVQTQLFDEESIQNMIRNFPIKNTNIAYQICEAEYKDWNEEWEQNGFEPIIIDGQCCIHDGMHLPKVKFKLTVEINARLAFGTGTHETTRMMIRALMGIQTGNKSVMDCGCGTGILGIVALKLGASQVFAYDIDEWSVDNARHNAVINHVDSKYSVAQGDVAMAIAHHGEFDIVMANINRNVLLNDMAAYKSAMKSGGTLLLSGFYASDIDMIIAQAAKYKLRCFGMQEENGWACLKLCPA